MLLNRRKKDYNNWQKIQNYSINLRQILKRQKFVIIILTKILVLAKIYTIILIFNITKRRKFAIIILTKVLVLTIILIFNATNTTKKSTKSKMLKQKFAIVILIILATLTTLKKSIKLEKTKIKNI